MTSLRQLAGWAVLLLGLPCAWGARSSFFSPAWGNLLVSTDMTAQGRELTPPTDENPVYYLGRSLGSRLGTIPGDRLPNEQAMNRLLAAVLARQGYRGAEPGGQEPTLFLVVQWGYLNRGNGDLLWFLGYNARDDIAAPAFPGQLGPEIWRRGFRSRTTETILDYASTSVYGVIVTAFEYQSARTPAPLVYWQSRIALPADGKSMAEALPAMIRAAGPSIGRESSNPLLVDVAPAREGRVELGDLQFRGVVDEPAGRDTPSPPPR